MRLPSLGVGMKRRQVFREFLAFGLIFLGSSGSMGQSNAQKPVIGLLDAGERPEWWDAFRQQLRVLGHVEGRNVVFEQRYAKGSPERLTALTNELVQLNVAVIVTSATSAAEAAERATRKIPIVMASGGGQCGRGC